MERVKIGIVGGGEAALAHARRLLAVEGVTLVGCADVDSERGQAFVDALGASTEPIPRFDHHGDLLRSTAPDALAIFTPQPLHYRPAMDGLQAGCHLFIETPLSTSVQEAVDIAGLARGRGLKVGVGDHFRRLPSLSEARKRLLDGAIGRVSLVTAILVRPVRVTNSLGRPILGGLASDGIPLLDALLWTLNESATQVASFQEQDESGLDRTTAATVRLSNGTLATIGISAASKGPLFELTYHGELGRIRATEATLIEELSGDSGRMLDLPDPGIGLEADFVAALRGERELCGSADEALDAIRLLEAISRSSTIGQIVGLG